MRCRRCRTYLNPYVEVSEQGTRWRCNLCVLLNDFPSNYDYNVGESRYIDRGEHPELRCPVYEYYAPAEYTVRPPQPPVYVFLLDASNSSINAGILQATAISISTTILANLPNCSGRTKVALMTYDLNSVHYYLFSREESENSRLPRMLVVTEFDDTQAAPSPEDLIVDLEKSSESFKLALDSLPSIHAANKALPIGSCLGSAVSLAMRLAAPYGGKIVAVHASPVVKGDGSTVASSNSNRPVSTDSVTRMLGTPKESSLLQPASSYYKSLAADCSKTQVSIDIFAFAPDINPPQISHGSIKITNNYNPTYLHLDLATLSTMTKHTGGRLFYYTVPAAGINSDESLSQKYTGDLNSHLCDKNLGLEAVLRIRASQGLSISGYHGSFFLRSTDLLSLPNVNPAHSYTAQVTIEETLQGNRVAFQAAVLHTNTRGERRIRVINASLPLTDDPRELISSADAPMIGSLLARMAIDKTVGSEGVGGIFSGAAGGRLEDARDAILNKTIDILSASRTINATTQHAPIPLLHPTLRILPLLLLACAKSLYLRPGPSSYPDARIHVMCLTKTMCVRDLIRSLHPYLIAIHTLSIDKNAQPNLPKPLPLSSEVLERHGLFLMHDASDFYFWIGSECHSQLLTLLFGNPNVQPGSVSFIYSLTLYFLKFTTHK